MSATDPVTSATPDVVSAPSDKDASNLDEKTKAEANSLYTYIFIGILSVMLLLLLYYAYNRFTTNTVSDPFVEGNRQERDDPVVDFNLREAINELQQIQARVLKTLSENS